MGQREKGRTGSWPEMSNVSRNEQLDVEIACSSFFIKVLWEFIFTRTHGFSLNYLQNLSSQVQSAGPGSSSIVTKADATEDIFCESSNSI